MADVTIQSTEKMVGANHPTLTDTLNRLGLVEHNNDGTHKKLTQVTDPWVDARAYGAVGNGTTDDTAALQAALNLVPINGILDLANKTYKVSAGLTLANGATIRNGKITWSVTSAIDIFTVKDNTIFDNVRFNGSGAIGTVGVPLYQRAIFGGTNPAIPAINVTIKNCRFENMTGGIWSGGASTDSVPTGWKIFDNHFENIVGYKGNSEGYAVILTPSSKGLVSGNTFKTITRFFSRNTRINHF